MKLRIFLIQILIIFFFNLRLLVLKKKLFQKNVPYFREKAHTFFENPPPKDFESAVDNTGIPGIRVIPAVDCLGYTTVRPSRRRGAIAKKVLGPCQIQPCPALPSIIYTAAPQKRKNAFSNQKCSQLVLIANISINKDGCYKKD